MNILGAHNKAVGSGFTTSSKPEQSLECGHGLFSTVVPKDELIQVNLQLSAAHAMICTNKPLLKVTNGAVSQGNDRFLSFAQFGSQRLNARDVMVATSRPEKLLSPSV